MAQKCVRCVAYLDTEDSPNRKLSSLLSFRKDIVDVVKVASDDLDLV